MMDSSTVTLFELTGIFFVWMLAVVSIALLVMKYGLWLYSKVFRDESAADGRGK